MYRIKLFKICVLLLSFIFIATSCSGTDSKQQSIAIIGSTLADSLIKTQLSIPQQMAVDFIKWELTMNNDNSFLLHINFGVGKAGTPGFIDGGEKMSFGGTYKLLTENEWVVYRLNTDRQTVITFVKVNDNIFHLLDVDNKLLVGNGGWSYTLNRKSPVKSIVVPTLTPANELTKFAPQQEIFEGRTPCQEIGAEHPELNVKESCNKIKWRMILNRDPIDNQPTTCILRKVVNNESVDVTVAWKVIKGISSNPDAIIYQIDSDKPQESFSFLLGDKNILFLLDKNNMLYVGNEEFSYTLNKKTNK